MGAVRSMYDRDSQIRNRGGNVPIVIQSCGFKPGNGAEARSIGYEEETAPTLNTCAYCGGAY